MRFKSTITLLLIFCLVILAYTPTAQSQDVDEELVQYKEAYYLLKTIKKGEEERDKEIEKIQKSLNESIKSIETANEEFDNMVKAVEKAGALGDPKGDFIKKLQDLALQADKDAQEAYADGDKEYGDKFMATKNRFIEITDEAIGLYSSIFRDIRAIEEHKRKVIRAIKLSEYEMALKLANDGINIIKDVQKQVAKVRDRLPAPEGPVE